MGGGGGRRGRWQGGDGGSVCIVKRKFHHLAAEGRRKPTQQTPLFKKINKWNGKRKKKKQKTVDSGYRHQRFHFNIIFVSSPCCCYRCHRPLHTTPMSSLYIYTRLLGFFKAGLLGTNPHITNLKKKYLKYKRKEGEKKQWKTTIQSSWLPVRIYVRNVYAVCSIQRVWLASPSTSGLPLAPLCFSLYLSMK